MYGVTLEKVTVFHMKQTLRVILYQNRSGELPEKVTNLSFLNRGGMGQCLYCINVYSKTMLNHTLGHIYHKRCELNCLCVSC